MITKDHVERILRMNGLSPTASDEEIRSLLVSARWHDDDAELALMVLRENKNTREERVDTLHKVLNTDERLKPETISSLLGIEVDLKSDDLQALRKSKSKMSPLQAVSMFGAAVLIATVAVIIYYMHSQIDFFHL